MFICEVIGEGQGAMGNGQGAMGNGQWAMGNGQFFKVETILPSFFFLLPSSLLTPDPSTSSGHRS